MADELRSFDLPGSGLHCSVCGAGLPATSRRVNHPGFIVRERRCPNCGKINDTTERVIGARDVRSYERHSFNFDE